MIHDVSSLTSTSKHPVSPSLSPWHGVLSCVLLQVPLLTAPSWAGGKVSHLGDICLWWFQPWPSVGLFIRNCRYAAPHRIRLLGEFCSSLCSSLTCNTVLYKCSHLPMQGFIRLTNTAAVSADTDIQTFQMFYCSRISIPHSFKNHCKNNSGDRKDLLTPSPGSTVSKDEISLS